MNATMDPGRYRDLPFAYLTTTGRRTGNPHTIEIWFALDPDDPTRLIMMAGGGWNADWVANLARDPAVTIRLDDTVFPASAAVVQTGEHDEPLIRRVLAAKYQDRHDGQPLSDWASTALPVRYVLDRAGRALRTCGIVRDRCRCSVTGRRYEGARGMAIRTDAERAFLDDDRSSPCEGCLTAARRGTIRA